MAATLRQLQVVLYRYTTDTLVYIKKVREFCEKFSKWKITMEEDIAAMSDIKDRYDKINLKCSYFTKSKQKGKAFVKYMKGKVPQKTADTTAKLEKELSEILSRTLGGLKKLDPFQDAVAKLAVTSLQVFKQNQMLQLPAGFTFDRVRAVITAARLICPLLVEFKRDPKKFFLPKLQNVEMLKCQLNRYVQITEEICDTLEKCSFSYDWQKIMDSEVNLNLDLSEDNIRSMAHQIEQLDKIRKDLNFQMEFLFQDVSGSHFINEFNEKHPRMFQFLKKLEDCAAELEKMSKGAKISSVAGSSVGAVGGVLSIVGLALAPVTAGVSLALTVTGIGMGITSGVNSAVTTGAEIGVNKKYQKKANEVLQDFMEDGQSLQYCLQEVINQTVSKVEADDTDVVIGVGKIAGTAGAIGKHVYKLGVVTSAGKTVAQEGKAITTTSKMASDIPNIGKAATKAPFALSSSARVGLIAVNALFLGMDIFFICKDSASLAKGSETVVSQFIRARAALWSSEMDSWKKIRDSLIESKETSKRNRDILDTQFYSVGVM